MFPFSSVLQPDYNSHAQSLTPECNTNSNLPGLTKVCKKLWVDLGYMQGLASEAEETQGPRGTEVIGH